MLNEAPNNNDVKRVANNVFNEAPNSNDTTVRQEILTKGKFDEFVILQH